MGQVHHIGSTVEVHLGIRATIYISQVHLGIYIRQTNSRHQIKNVILLPKVAKQAGLLQKLM